MHCRAFHDQSFVKRLTIFMIWDQSYNTCCFQATKISDHTLKLKYLPHYEETRSKRLAPSGNVVNIRKPVFRK